MLKNEKKIEVLTQPLPRIKENCNDELWLYVV